MQELTTTATVSASVSGTDSVSHPHSNTNGAHGTALPVTTPFSPAGEALVEPVVANVANANGNGTSAESVQVVWHHPPAIDAARG